MTWYQDSSTCFFCVGHVCLIMDFYFKPIFIQLPERTAMQKRSEEAVFLWQVPRYPGTQVEMEEMDSPSMFEAYNKQKEKLFVFVYSSDTNWSAGVFYEIVGSLCTEGSSSKAWMLSVKGSFRWRRRRFVRCVGWYSELALPSREIQTFSESVLSTMNLGFLGETSHHLPQLHFTSGISCSATKWVRVLLLFSKIWP